MHIRVYVVRIKIDTVGKLIAPVNKVVPRSLGDSVDQR